MSSSLPLATIIHGKDEEGFYMQCAIPSKIREMIRILEIIAFEIDLRVCWGQGCRGQVGVGEIVRNLPKTQVKKKKTGVITLNSTPV